MQPIGKYIAVRDDHSDIKTESGILLSGEDATQLRYRRAVVIKRGTEVQSIKDGDVVYYDKGSSFTMLIKDEQVTIIREGDVVVVE
jgi:co-chaperonin GroES (HSP10)